MEKKLSHFIFILFFTFSAAIGQTKHALIFAIGNYANWPHISSLRDVNLIDTVLKKQKFQDIKIITDQDATMKGVANAFNDLISRVNSGDIVVIHFSSHGEQVEDDNRDETDGLDECIVTYNALFPPRTAFSREEYNKFQAEYFRDDEFGVYIDKLRAKLGANGDIIVFMDLCHSGTGTRGLAKVRGGQPPLVSLDFDPKKKDEKDSAGVFREKIAPRRDENNLATYVVYSAAEAGELDYETEDDNHQGVGSLSYAVSKAFSDLDTATTYRSLFAKIQSVMNEKAANQHPVLEGDGLDRTLFGGKFLRQQPYIEIEKIASMKVVLKAGKIQGLDAGAEVAVYPAGTIDTLQTEKLARGLVVSASSFTCVVNLTNELKIKQPAAGWVFITEPVYNIESLSISIVSDKTSGQQTTQVFTEAEAATIKKVLSDLPLIKFEGAPDLTIVKGTTSDSIKISSNGYLFDTISDAGLTNSVLHEKIQRYIQYKFLQGLNINDPGINVEVKLLPFINGIADTSGINTSIAKTYEFSNGDQFVLWVKNTSHGDMYFNVLDMQPDGVINKVLPDKTKGIYPGDLLLKAGSSYMFSKYPIKVSPPYGTEIFKIFVSRERIDMEDIATTRGVGTRGRFSVLEGLVKKSYEVGTRGTETDNIRNADGSTFNLLFQIKEK
jgi:hypothetical protein